MKNASLAFLWFSFPCLFFAIRSNNLPRLLEQVLGLVLDQQVGHLN
jgi:hypothetical protein